MSDSLADLKLLYGDLPLSDLLRLQWAANERDEQVPLETLVALADDRDPTERQLRLRRDSTVSSPAGAYRRGYPAGYGN